MQTQFENKCILNSHFRSLFRFFWTSCILVAAFIVPTYASAAYIQGVSNYGIVIVNKSNGGLIFCTYVNSGTTPTGRCAKIGTFPGAPISNPIQIDASGLTAFITNLSTGVVALCSLTMYVNGTPTGSCIVQQAQ